MSKEETEEVKNEAENDSEPLQKPPVGGEDETNHAEAEELEDLKAKIAELEAAKLRMAAENQNTRKRLVKQQQAAHTYRHQDILRDVIEVMDNFERAIESSAESRDFDSFHEGILMIEKQFSGMLTERYGLERIGEEGEAFNPAAHEAMYVEESDEVDCESVKQVLQAGYKLHDRVLRPAKVGVLKPVQPDSSEKQE